MAYITACTVVQAVIKVRPTGLRHVNQITYCGKVNKVKQYEVRNVPTDVCDSDSDNEWLTLTVTLTLTLTEQRHQLKWRVVSPSSTADTPFGRKPSPPGHRWSYSPNTYTDTYRHQPIDSTNWYSSRDQFHQQLVSASSLPVGSLSTYLYLYLLMTGWEVRRTLNAPFLVQPILECIHSVCLYHMRR